MVTATVQSLRNKTTEFFRSLTKFRRRDFLLDAMRLAERVSVSSGSVQLTHRQPADIVEILHPFSKRGVFAKEWGVKSGS